MKQVPAIALSALTLVCAAYAQNTTPQLRCEQRGDGDSNRARACQVKEWTIPAAGHYSVDAGSNGGIMVHGWQRSDVLVRAKIETWAESQNEAQGLQGQVSVQTAGGVIRANAPQFSHNQGYAVSFEVFLPQRSDVDVNAHNGGVSVEDLTGRMNLETHNGGLNVRRLGGTVNAKTHNGGLNVELAGRTWEGNELIAATVNGGVNIKVPSGYSARFEADTVNGGFRNDVEMVVTGKVGKSIRGTMGSGGPLVKVSTQNGGVNVRTT